jgi:peptidoglycan-associated lipoprotein
MKHSFTFAPGKILATILVCMLLAACSTTQKSATGTGTQEAAPISDATKAEPGAPGTGGSASGTESPAEVGAISPNPDMTPEEQAAAAAAKGDEEAARLQQQLAEQEAQINRLREEQVKAQQLADEEAAKQRAADSAAAAAPPGSAPEGGGTGQAPAETAAAPDSAENTQVPSQAASAAAESAPSGVEPAPEQPLSRTIYFEYDNATIADEYDSVLVGHAAFLKANPDFRTEVQGNCDARGSREYNLALGARRAEAVKRALELAGADGSKIKAISFGAEKPVAFGKDEESYRKNRRADILY